MGKDRDMAVLEKIAKKLLRREVFSKFNLVEDAREKAEVMKHSIKRAIEMQMHELEKNLGAMAKDSFFAEMKLRTLRSKVKLFLATYHEKDFNNVEVLIKEVEKEIKNAV